MTSTPSRLDLIDTIRSLPQELEMAVDGLTGEQLDTPYGEGKWTVRQVVHHIAESHCNAFGRFKWILTEDNPELKVYDQDKWAALPDCNMPIEPSLDIIRGLHQRWAYLLELVDDSAWARTARHSEDGEFTLDRLLEVYANHGAKHVGHIVGLIDNKGW